MHSTVVRETPTGFFTRALLIGAGALAAAMLATALLATSAEAATAYTSKHPRDGSWATYESHNYAVCDADPDNHKTYAHVWQHYVLGSITTGYDTYGRDRYGRYCYHAMVGFYPIRAIQVCVQYEGCGPIKGVGYPRASVGTSAAKP